MDRDAQLLVLYFEYAQYPVLEHCIKRYLKNNYDVLTGDVIPDSIVFGSIDVADAFAKEIENNIFQFRVIATASIINNKRIDGMEYNGCVDYVTVELIFSGRLIDEELNVECLNVMKYSNDKEEQGTLKPHYSISYIPQDSLDNEAEKFLSKYYPEALMTPGAIEIDKLLKRMRLQLYYAPLEKNVLGKILFYDDVQEVFQDQSTPSRVTEYKSLTNGTILLAPRGSDSYNHLRSRLFTIVHECVHWERHQNRYKLMHCISDYMDWFFNTLEYTDLQLCHNDFSPEQIELLREKKKELLYYKKVNYWKSYSCNGELKKEGPSTYNDMEWQANNLAARILMPEKTTRRKLYEILSNTQKQFPNMRNGEIMEKAIRKLADFYHVSQTSAKYRAIQLGFEQAAGVLNYVDNQIVEPIYFSDGTLSKYQTLIVDGQVAEKEMVENKRLKFLMKNGRVVYLNGMFIFNHPRYVGVDIRGNLQPTEYALEHADECCFVFTVQQTWNQDYDEFFYATYSLNRPINSTKRNQCFVNLEDPHNSTLERIISRPEEVKREIDEMLELLEQGVSGIFPGKGDKAIWMIEGLLPATFHQTLQWHISRLISKKDSSIDNLLDVAINCLLDKSSVENHLEQKNNPILPTVIAYCIGLHLEPLYALDLINKAGHNILRPTFESVVYLYLVIYYRFESIETCNWIIQEINKRDQNDQKRQVRYIPNDKKGK